MNRDFFLEPNKYFVLQVLISILTNNILSVSVILSQCQFCNNFISFSTNCLIKFSLELVFISSALGYFNYEIVFFFKFYISVKC